MPDVYAEGSLEEFIEINRIIPRIVYECILTTGAGDETNAAPMGVVIKKDMIVLRPFKTTKSYRLLMRAPYGVVNFTDDVEVFYATAFDTEGSFSELLTASVSVPTPSLANTYARLEFVVDSVADEHGDRATFNCRVLKALWKHGYIRPYTRAEHAIIESLIHATRIKCFLERGMAQEAVRLALLVKHYDALVSRIAPNTVYSSIMDKLRTLISGWGLSGLSPCSFEFQDD
ncbi:MAG: DUF447 family protein [Nitrososphaerota archaeon]